LPLLETSISRPVIDPSNVKVPDWFDIKSPVAPKLITAADPTVSPLDPGTVRFPERVTAPFKVATGAAPSKVMEPAVIVPPEFSVNTEAEKVVVIAPETFKVPPLLTVTAALLVSGIDPVADKVPPLLTLIAEPEATILPAFVEVPATFRVPPEAVKIPAFVNVPPVFTSRVPEESVIVPVPVVLRVPPLFTLIVEPDASIFAGVDTVPETFRVPPEAVKLLTLVIVPLTVTAPERTEIGPELVTVPLAFTVPPLNVIAADTPVEASVPETLSV
jgi:hypothetical protein